MKGLRKIWTIDETNIHSETFLALSEEGHLEQNALGAWLIVFPDHSFAYLMAGSLIELKIRDSWVLTRIDRNEDGFYSVTPGILLCQGLSARVFVCILPCI